MISIVFRVGIWYDASMRKTDRLRVSPAERLELNKRVKSRKASAGDVRRARLILLLVAGTTWEVIATVLGCSPAYIARWKSRFDEERLAGLYPRHKGKKATVLTPKTQARILAATQKKPRDGSTHWSTRKLAKHLGLTHMAVARAWQQGGIKPHQMKRYMASNDPDFEAKAADIIGLYINPPQHAAVFCVDEKTAIQALDRRDPVLPFSAGRAERHGFEYYRHGTLSLYAAFNTGTGDVIGKTARSHTSNEFVAFLGDIAANQPAGKEIHVIVDNLSAHKTRKVEEFLESHSNMKLHFTPTYSSWINQVENWFSKIQRDVIARGIFTSVEDLSRKLLRYIKSYNKEPKRIKWIYRDPNRRIKLATDSSVTVH